MGIDSMSLSPHRVLETLPRVAEAEQRAKDQQEVRELVIAGGDPWC